MDWDIYIDLTLILEYFAEHIFPKIWWKNLTWEQKEWLRYNYMTRGEKQKLKREITNFRKKIKQHFRDKVKEELMAYVWHPRRVHFWRFYDVDMDFEEEEFT